MAKFLIEVPHEAEVISCARAVKAFLSTGSQFLARAEWGCLDGDHRAVMMVDVESKEEARRILPPMYRAVATITGLNRFTIEEMDEILRSHKT